MNKQQIKNKITDYEYYRSGLQHLSGTDVEVKNLKILKNKAIADIILHNHEENSFERYNKCEYDLKELENK